ncbi:hypothetical protein Ndes2437B_g05646 [Nannochloris sp. 'desiccata']
MAKTSPIFMAVVLGVLISAAAGDQQPLLEASLFSRSTQERFTKQASQAGKSIEPLSAKWKLHQVMQKPRRT